jgi:hypothetical protein
MKARLAVAIPLALGLLSPAPAAAEDIVWHSELTFYGDNTEFDHGPYRIGETILGGQFQTFLSLWLGPQVEVRAGVFGDHRSGENRKFLDPVKPILAFRYKTEHSLGVFGTLETRNRHGYLEPLEVTTLEFTRPIEYGLQWIEDRPRFHGEVYINWQHLNTSTSREIFDYGMILRYDPLDFLSVEGQLHGLHHGGQLFDVGPVTNNPVLGPGIRVWRDLPFLGEASLRAFYLVSSGKPDPFVGTPTIRGHGVYVRPAIHPGGWFELFGIWWRGKNFITNEGDHNYGSPGVDGFYKADRRYGELGVVKRLTLARGIDVDPEFRLNWIDGKLDYSYRLVVRAPFDLKLR